jgi:hypothetical protein
MPEEREYWDGTGDEPWHSRMSTEMAAQHTYASYPGKFNSLIECVDYLIEMTPDNPDPEQREASLSLIDYKHRLEAENNGETN